MTWAKWFAAATMIQLGAFIGALLHTAALHALVVGVLFFVATAAMANVEESRRHEP